MVGPASVGPTLIWEINMEIIVLLALVALAFCIVMLMAIENTLYANRQKVRDALRQATASIAALGAALTLLGDAAHEATGGFADLTEALREVEGDARELGAIR